MRGEGPAPVAPLAMFLMEYYAGKQAAVLFGQFIARIKPGTGAAGQGIDVVVSGLFEKRSGDVDPLADANRRRGRSSSSLPMSSCPI